MTKANSAISTPPPSAEDDPVAIAVRAYVRHVGKSAPDAKGRRDRANRLGASSIVLVFDTETNLDAAQHLRFGTYQVRIDGKLDEEGLFFDLRTTSKRDQLALRRYADKHGLQRRALSDFIDSVF